MNKFYDIFHFVNAFRGSFFDSFLREVEKLLACSVRVLIVKIYYLNNRNLVIY